MSLFACRNCLCVENTACTNYWSEHGKPHLCSECDKEIGTWHGKFTKRSASGMLVGSDGFLYLSSPSHVSTLGTVQ
jgi:hypothetical protein